VAEALRQVCSRRGLVYDRIFPQGIDGLHRSRNSLLDNNIAAHFMRSVLDQSRGGNRFAALRTALECVRLHPLDPHYFKALVYALMPSSVVDSFRRRLPAAEERTRGC